MRMSEFVVREAIIPELQAATRDGVIREMIEAIKAAGYFRGTDVEEVIAAVLRREALASTGIGRCVAIPHTKHKGVDRLVGTVGISKPGIDFRSLDNEPVHVIVALASPHDRPKDHLRALDNVSRRLRDEHFVQQLREAGTKEAIWTLIADADRNN